MAKFHTITNPIITAILDEMIKNDEDARKINAYPEDERPIFMPFHIDTQGYSKRHYAYRFAFSHYYKQNGDMVPDPDMVVFYWPATGGLAATTFQDYRSYQDVLDHSITGGIADPETQRELTEFLEIWLNNVVEQQNLRKGGSPEPMPTTTLDDTTTTRHITEGTRTATTLSLADFIEKFKDPIAENIHRRFTPVYDITSDMSAEDAAIAQLQTRSQELGKPLFTAQEHIAKAAKTLLADKGGKCLFVIGEMGSGKSSISNAIAHIMGATATTNLIVCPPHLTQKWEREIRETFPKSTRLQVFQIRSIRDFEAAKTEATLYDKTFFILSREKSKLSYYWKPDYITKTKPVTVEATREDGDGNIVKYKTVEYHKLAHCPVCHTMIIDPRTGTVQEAKQLAARRQFCQHEYTETVQAPDNSFEEVTRKCGTPFFTADREGPRRYALADYIAKRNKNYFDLLIIDEVHEGKAKGSANGQAYGTLAGACRKTISLTGTIFGGKSSSLFYLLYRFSAGFKKQYKYTEEHEFVKKYGIQWTINKETEIQSDGRSSRRKTSPARIEEKPGISPEIILHLIDKAVFINLQDIDNALPSYTETPIECRMLPAQGMQYALLEKQMKADLAKALAKNDKRMLSKYLQVTLTYPDLPEDPETTYPKEQSLIDTVKAERSQGRRVLVYATHTDQRDITPRLRQVLEREGLTVAVMKATVKAEKREAWIRAAVAEGIDCLICNPALVKTGLDLIDFPTIYYYEIDFNIYTMRQSSRRSWRIGQTQPVRVYFACYAKTMQQRALTLVAKKLKAAEMIDGELTDDGLSGYKDEGSLLVDLAKSMLDDIKTDNNTLEGLFQGKAAQAQDMTGFIGYDAPRKVIPSPQTPSPRPQPANDLWMTMYAEKIAAKAPKRAVRAAAPAEPTLSLF